MSDDAIPIVRDALAAAIASCASAWQKRWHRAPTTNELTHALEVCLAANPDEYVSDVGAVLAMSEPAAAPNALDFESFDVVFRDTSTYGVPQAELYAPKVKKDPGLGEVQAYLEPRGDTLVVDVQCAPHGKAPSFAVACDLVRARVLHRWIARRDLEIARVVFRPLSGIEPAIALAWPPPDE